jgi:hypothetical protein
MLQKNKLVASLCFIEGIKMGNSLQFLQFYSAHKCLKYAAPDTEKEKVKVVSLLNYVP